MVGIELIEKSFFVKIERKKESDRSSGSMSPTAPYNVNFQVHVTRKKSTIRYLDLHFVLSGKVIFLVSDRESGEVLKSEYTTTFRIVNLANVSFYNNKKCDTLI